MKGKPITPTTVLKWTLTTVAVIVLLIAVIVGIITGINTWSRSQARANAHNNVSITGIQIQNQRQYARVIAAHSAVISQQAYQRYLEAVGIRHAQDEISKTLTPLYVQHEAIQALQAVATSGRNNTVVYVPSGQNGVPLVTAQAGSGK